jgi:hypothetical protein
MSRSPDIPGGRAAAGGPAPRRARRQLALTMQFLRAATFRKVGCVHESELLLRLQLLYSHRQIDETLPQLLRTLGGNQRARVQNGVMMTTPAAGVLARLHVARAWLHAADPVIAGLAASAGRHTADGLVRGAGVPGDRAAAVRRAQAPHSRPDPGAVRRSPAVSGGIAPGRSRRAEAGWAIRAESQYATRPSRTADRRPTERGGAERLPDEQIIAELTQFPGYVHGPCRAL